jgi:hypothetical protein
MINHPRPAVLARNLRQLADRLDDEGDRAIRQAPILAARGWPTSVNGSEGGRSSDPTSSTERAALKPGPFDDIDNRIARQLCYLWAGILHLHASLDTVMAHASDHDPVPPGTGPCAVDGCHHICQPRKNPNDRLRAGYCPKHHKRWLRLGRPDRSWYERFTETEDVA